MDLKLKSKDGDTSKEKDNKFKKVSTQKLASINSDDVDDNKSLENEKSDSKNQRATRKPTRKSTKKAFKSNELNLFFLLIN